MFLDNCHPRRERSTAMIIATGTRPKMQMMRISGIPGMPIASIILRLFLTSDVDYWVFVSSNLRMGSGITSRVTRYARKILHFKNADSRTRVHAIVPRLSTLTARRRRSFSLLLKSPLYSVISCRWGSTPDTYGRPFQLRRRQVAPKLSLIASLLTRNHRFVQKRSGRGGVQ